VVSEQIAAWRQIENGTARQRKRRKGAQFGAVIGISTPHLKLAKHVGVLFMAYGSPNRLVEVEAYFTDIRGGRRPTPDEVAELSTRYQQVGVPTPLLDVSRRLTEKVERALNQSGGARFTARLGMKHWTPRIQSAVQELVQAGVDQVVGVVLAPHYSRIGTGGYQVRVERAMAESDRRVPLDFVQSWFMLPGYLRAVAENVRAAVRAFNDPESVTVVFTAHSLPARIIDEGDPYRDQLLQTSESIAQLVPVSEWRFSFQSQSHTGEPWLGPDLLDTLAELAAGGRRRVVVAPVGFIADHLEILYDIDIEARHKARELGMELQRTRMLNDDSRLAEALAQLVLKRSLAR
jgi:ferrochelatase